jgi:hypothetical protein
MLAEAGVWVLGVERIEEQRRPRLDGPGLQVRIKSRRDPHFRRLPESFHGLCFVVQSVWAKK